MSTSHATPKRPWYCADSLVDGYLEQAKNGDDLTVMKGVKAVESLIVNAGIVAIVLVALHFGEANAYVVIAGISVLGLLNGVLVSDYRAVAQAIVELSQAAEADAETEGEEDDGGS